ncbi:hypothetical protein ACFFGV_14520 [Pontibacillus salicampi]|uniref:Alpha/beta hydrolase n=1 Tax=Pontibacillus salicampi TaxID=1449801 RepID=A0ABV6LR88_9BACI
MDNSQATITRTFTLDKQPCLLHIPEKPNGFLVLYLGDAGHYVEEHQSFWSEHPARAELLQSLLNRGYTLFTCHLYGNGWGSPKTTHLLQQVFQTVKRQEIVNPFIHVVSEGMGTYTAFRWELKYDIPIRSHIMFTPCLDLKAMYNQEQSNQLYFKKLNKELAKAYEIEEKQTEEQVIQPATLVSTKAPSLIFHDVQSPYYSVHEHSRRFEENQEQQGIPVWLKLAIQPILPRVTPSIVHFLMQQETRLDSPI